MVGPVVLGPVVVSTVVVGTVVVSAVLLATPTLTAQLPATEEVARLERIAQLGSAQAGRDGGTLGLVQAVRDARSDLCVVFVASHPDDQYLLPATYLRLAYGFRVHVVLLTRGEGGQNSAGPEVGDELGKRRTLETEACGRQLGLQIWHLNRPDAGFCRTAEEAFRSWNRERTVRELAKRFRSIRPDVVLTTHHPKENHGHDLALLDVLPDAVTMAESPEFVTPERPPIRVFGVWRGSDPGTTPAFALSVGDVEAERGKTYVEIAHRALREHESQAPIRPAEQFFEDAERFEPLRQPAPPDLVVPEADLLSRLEEMVRNGALPRQRLTSIRIVLGDILENERDRSKLILYAARLRRLLGDLPVGDDVDLAVRIARRREALARVIWFALGLAVRTSTTNQGVAVPGQPFEFAIEFAAPTRSIDPVEAHIVDLEIRGRRDEVRQLDTWDSGRTSPWKLRAVYQVPEDALRDAPLERLFRRDRLQLPFVVDLAVRIQRENAVDEVTLPLELPVTVRPAIEVNPLPEILLVPETRDEALFNVRVRTNGNGPAMGRLETQAPAGFRIEPASIELDPTAVTEQGFLFRVRFPEGAKLGTSSLALRLIDSDEQTLVQRSIVLRRVPVRIDSTLRVGLIEGVDDASRNALRQLGVTVVPLTPSELPVRPLDDLDTILVDVRALAHHDAARAEFNRLVAFARNGGRLVVLYHKDSELAPGGGVVPFHPPELPFTVGKGRVTREDAPVRILASGHPLMTQPNRIDRRDFDGWVHERGLYFPNTWHETYTPLLASKDPNEEEQRGALIHARVGRGEFVYCALALHRQLKNLHPGATRLFANLVTPAK